MPISTALPGILYPSIINPPYRYSLIECFILQLQAITEKLPDNY